MLSCYEFDVGISNTDLMRETDVRLTASFVQNALVGSIGAGLAREACSRAAKASHARTPQRANKL